MAIKAFLMQNLSLSSSSSTKFPTEEGDESSNSKFGCLPPENGFNLKKMSFMSRVVILHPKLTPHVNFSNFQAEENFLIFKIFGMS